MNKAPVLKFPVICPRCHQELLTTLPLGIVAAALISGKAIRLYASCHDVYWDAHRTEIEQIREYMAAPWLEVQAPSYTGPAAAVTTSATEDGINYKA